MSDRILLVTGGARGIGGAVCRRLAQEGYQILLNFNLSRQAAEDLASDLSRQTKILLHQGDMSKPQDVRSLLDLCQVQYGNLDVLVNTASYSTAKGWYSLDGEFDWTEWQKTIEIDLKGTMLCCHAARTLMKSGKIINFSSSAALYGDVPTYFYTAAKSGIVGITKALAKAYAPDIQVNCIAPGSIATDWIQKWKLTPEQVREIASESPAQRIGEPEEVAELVLFLASPNCRFMTGQTLIIDGGIHMP